MISRLDRELLDIWESEGIPDDLSTNQHALELLLRLWAEYSDLLESFRDLLDITRRENWANEDQLTIFEVER